MNGRDHSGKDNIKMHLKEIGCGLNSTGSRFSAGTCQHSSKPDIKCRGIY